MIPCRLRLPSPKTGVCESRETIYLSPATTSFFNEPTLTSHDLSVTADDQRAPREKGVVCTLLHTSHRPAECDRSSKRRAFVTYVWLLLPRMRHFVLMVGHDRGQFASYRDYLRGSGLHLVTTSDPREAVRLVNALRPALDIIDVWSLGEIGWDICNVLRATHVSRSTPMLIMADATGTALRMVKARARRLNCTVLPRTLEQDELVDFVAAVIGLSRPPEP